MQRTKLYLIFLEPFYVIFDYIFPKQKEIIEIFMSEVQIPYDIIRLISTYTTNNKYKISNVYFICLIIIGWFINSITWFRLGDAYRSYLLSKKANMKLPTLLGTVIAERFVDTAVIFLFLCIS